MENLNSENSQSELPKMKILQTLQKYFSANGIEPNSAEQLRSFNAKILMGFLVLGYGIVSVLIYVFSEAKTFLEIAQSIFTCSTLILMTFYLMTMVFHMREFFEMFISCGCLVNTSKWN